MEEYRILGIMSGTSLDGVDMAVCYFKKQAATWTYVIEKAACFEYDVYWKDKLKTLPTATAEELALADTSYGSYIGELAQQFLKDVNEKPTHIASHGHTIFHQPQNKLTLQIGNGFAIAVTSNLPVINQFRNKDVHLGGQGAPLVPVGDALLFSDMNYCLNIGGIANISYTAAGKRIAYDICPANMVLNKLAEELGFEYDDAGTIAKSGVLDKELLEKLNSLDYYSQHPPKSLGREWVEQEVFSLLTKDIAVTDALHTFTEHIAQQIASSTTSNQPTKLLVTGGGAFNTYLIDKIRAHAKNVEVVLPSKEVIAYKEAVIFAFLGVLFLRNEVNCLSSVTGAIRDNVGGVLYTP